MGGRDLHPNREEPTIVAPYKKFGRLDDQPEPLKPLIRVVAAAMQSQIDRHPRRTGPLLPADYQISLHIWNGKFSGPVVYQVMFQGSHRQPDLHASLFYDRDRRQWSGPCEESTAQDHGQEITQEAAERFAATAFTFPFPVARVHDKTIAHAAWMVYGTNRSLFR